MKIMTTELDRLQLLIKTEEMSAKDFAAEVGISASTMSNILGGRNKPSLEVMQKILNRFRLISSDWLILGIGTMYKSKQSGQEQTLFDLKPATNLPTEHIPNQLPVSDIIPEQKIFNEINSDNVKGNINNKQISKIIVFFDDDSFQEILRQ